MICFLVIFPKAFQKSTKFEADIIKDLVLCWKFHDGADLPFHDLFQWTVLINVFGITLHLFLCSQNIKYYKLFYGLQNLQEKPTKRFVLTIDFSLEVYYSVLPA